MIQPVLIKHGEIEDSKAAPQKVSYLKSKKKAAQAVKWRAAFECSTT